MWSEKSPRVLLSSGDWWRLKEQMEALVMIKSKSMTSAERYVSNNKAPHGLGRLSALFSKVYTVKRCVDQPETKDGFWVHVVTSLRWHFGELICISARLRVDRIEHIKTLMWISYKLPQALSVTFCDCEALETCSVSLTQWIQHRIVLMLCN